jgi:hypothetical protein
MYRTFSSQIHFISFWTTIRSRSVLEQGGDSQPASASSVGLGGCMSTKERGGRRNSKEALIREWGMTDEEAESHTRQRPAYICAVLKGPRGLPLGVLFVDSTEPEAFGSKD